MLTAALLLCAGIFSNAQSNDAPHGLPESPTPVGRSIEDLNYLGGDAAMPPFSDSVIDLDSGFRRALLRKGLAFRVITGPQYTQNILDTPVSADEQVYVGQRAFESMFVQPIISADLHQLHLRQAQLYLGGVWNWASWNPAGPKSLQLWALYFYKAFGENRLEVKAGYIANNMNFVGLFVGGSTATGAQGVYAVLPYEAGMSYFPLTAPSFNVRIRGPKNTYIKTAAQRSFDPNGGPTEVARNHTGFRFIPRGDKLVLINEAGYLRTASADAHQAWFRAGSINNTTPYRNEASGRLDYGQLLRVRPDGLSIAQVRTGESNPWALRRWIVHDGAGHNECLRPLLRSTALPGSAGSIASRRCCLRSCIPHRLQQDLYRQSRLPGQDRVESWNDCHRQLFAARFTG